jgi:hypothetical protein
MRTLPRVFRLPFVATVALLALAGPARAGVDTRLGPLVASIVDEAGARLDRPGCALVLLDFADGRTGLPLAQTLAASGLSASERVRALTFTKSPKPPRVGPLRIYAYTHPGDSEVFLDRSDFSRIVGRRGLAVAIVIHETLHTLGLANDLPSSEGITERVLARCDKER